jgi:hypothetical protein
VLLARRLVEQGVPLVSVNWHNDGRNFWDTHGHNFSRLKRDLIPPSDQALSALLEDLDQRGMLEDTIVAWRRQRLYACVRQLDSLRRSKSRIAWIPSRGVHE